MIAGVETIVYTASMELTGKHQDRQLVISAFLARLQEMENEDQPETIVDLLECIVNFTSASPEEAEEWRTNIEEIFVDPPVEIVYLDLDNPAFLDEAFRQNKEQSAARMKLMSLSNRQILSLSEAKALAKDPEFARSMEEAANDPREGKGTVLPAGTFPSTDSKAVDDRGQ